MSDRVGEGAHDLSAWLPAVQALGDTLRARGWQLATAESCTGGLIAAACTALAGSSDWFAGGVVSYTNAAKTALLGVDADLITHNGAVSEPVARAMALGALERFGVDLAVAVTGIAGPGGAVPGKPVGTVWLAIASRGPRAEVQMSARRWQFGGDRTAVRHASVVQALADLAARAGDAVAP